MYMDVTLLKRIVENIEAQAAEMAELSDDLAAHPEVSGNEKRTSAKLIEVLRKADFEIESPCLAIPYSFLARKGRRGGPRVAILAEYDALPEVGHGCGHNLHGCMSVLAGAALAPIIDEMDGELYVVGTPAEETNGAKVRMAEEGLFDGCALAIMIHSACGKSTLIYRSLAMHALEFTFTGQTAHAAMSPWDGRNALNGLQLFFHAVDMLRQHLMPEVRMHGIVADGGAAPNIVPDRAVGRFYFRAPKSAYLDVIMEKIYNCARGAALATETEVSWRFFEASFRDMLPNGAAEQLLNRIMVEEGVAVNHETLVAGSSDIGDVSYRCPAIQPKLDISEGRAITAHTREFAAATTTEAAHKALAKGALIIARAVCETLADANLRAAMQADFELEIARAKADAGL